MTATTHTLCQSCSVAYAYGDTTGLTDTTEEAFDAFAAVAGFLTATDNTVPQDSTCDACSHDTNGIGHIFTPEAD